MKNIYKRSDGCIKAITKTLFLGGEFSLDEYSELLLHTEKCSTCSEEMDGMESFIFNERPEFCLNDALNKVRTHRCLSNKLIKRFARQDVTLSSTSSLYAAYHLRFCARCYALFCQSLKVKRSLSPDGQKLTVELLVSTLNEKILAEMIGAFRYNIFREGLGVKPGDYIYNFLMRSGFLNLTLLALEYKKVKGQYELSVAYINKNDYFLDGLELRTGK